MSGSGAWVRRVFRHEERHPLEAEQVSELAELAARVRELTEAVVFTDVDRAEVAAVRAEIAALTRRLQAVRRDQPPVGKLEGHGMLRQLASPVTGVLNPIAPPVEIEILPDGTARCEFTLSAVYEGPPGFVHGGVCALVLDQLLGAAALANGTPGMTATLEMRYRRPTPCGVPLTAEAKAVRVEGRKTFVAARINGPDGRTTVEADGMFIMPSALLTQ
jgi:uncharacterized protein (TIGR00369 family)